MLRYDATGFPFLNNFGNVVFAGNFPNATSPGPDDRGENMFYGGPQRGSSSASQSIDLSGFAMQVDEGNLLFGLSGWMGGFMDQGDSARLALTFLDELGGALANAFIATPDAAARGNVTGLFLQSLEGLVPVGARSIDRSRV